MPDNVPLREPPVLEPAVAELKDVAERDPAVRAPVPANPAPKKAPPHKPLPVYDHPPAKVTSDQLRPRYVSTMLDIFFFVVAGVASVWLSVQLAADGFSLSRLWYWIPFWGVLAYLALPRIHRILTWIYVPNYFIGRTQTSDGLLGDPVNLGFRGREKQVHQVMEDSGWVLARELTMRTAWRMVVSSVLKRSYPQAPVSPLMLFGRRQDFAYQQEVNGNPHQRHHVRFWRAPDGWLLPGGHQADWLAAGTYDRSVGFSLFTLQFTHKIDANIDIERNYIVSTIEHAHHEVPVEILEDFSTGYHSRNGGGDLIQTDGDLPIVDVSVVATHGAQPVPRRPRRPASLVLGCILILLMSIVPTVAAVLAIFSPWLFNEPGLSAEDVSAVRVVLTAMIAVTVVVLTGLAVATAFGVVWTRTLLLFGLTFVIVLMGTAETKHGIASLIVWSLAILALVALSSTSVRIYVEDKRELRRAKRRRAKAPPAVH